MNQIVLFALVAAVVYLLMKPSVVAPHDHDEVVNAVRAAQVHAQRVSTRAVHAANYRADEAYRVAQRAHTRADSAVQAANAAAQRAAEDAAVQSRRRHRRRQEREKKKEDDAA